MSVWIVYGHAGIFFLYCPKTMVTTPSMPTNDTPVELPVA
jgi:hypothetical protein